MDIKVMAEVYRLGIAIGYFTVQDVIDWADALIESLEQPPDELIDISLSSNAKLIDVCSLLHSFYGSPFNDSPLHIMLSMLSNEHTTSNNLAKVSAMLFELIDFIQLEDCSKGIIIDLLYLSDAYYLAKQGIYGDLQAVENDIKKFLQSFEI